MIFICIVMVVIAVPLFMLVSGDNRRRKHQNPHPFVPEAPRQNRGDDPD